jgi:hypothetical protein
MAMENRISIFIHYFISNPLYKSPFLLEQLPCLAKMYRLI